MQVFYHCATHFSIFHIASFITILWLICSRWVRFPSISRATLVMRKSNRQHLQATTCVYGQPVSAAQYVLHSDPQAGVLRDMCSFMEIRFLDALFVQS